MNLEDPKNLRGFTDHFAQEFVVPQISFWLKNIFQQPFNISGLEKEYYDEMKKVAKDLMEKFSPPYQNNYNFPIKFYRVIFQIINDSGFVLKGINLKIEIPKDRHGIDRNHKDKDGKLFNHILETNISSMAQDYKIIDSSDKYIISNINIPFLNNKDNLDIWFVLFLDKKDNFNTKWSFVFGNTEGIVKTEDIDPKTLLIGVLPRRVFDNNTKQKSTSDFDKTKEAAEELWKMIVKRFEETVDLKREPSVEKLKKISDRLRLTRRYFDQNIIYFDEELKEIFEKLYYRGFQASLSDAVKNLKELINLKDALREKIQKIVESF